MMTLCVGMSDTTTTTTTTTDTTTVVATPPATPQKSPVAKTIDAFYAAYMSGNYAECTNYLCLNDGSTLTPEQKVNMATTIGANHRRDQDIKSYKIEYEKIADDGMSATVMIEEVTVTDEKSTYNNDLYKIDGTWYINLNSMSKK